MSYQQPSVCHGRVRPVWHLPSSKVSLGVWQRRKRVNDVPWIMFRDNERTRVRHQSISGDWAFPVASACARNTLSAGVRSPVVNGWVSSRLKTVRFTRTWLRYVSLLWQMRLASVVCLSSVTFVRPTQGVETVGNIFSLFCTLAILWPPCKI